MSELGKCARCEADAVTVVQGEAACTEHLDAVMYDAMAPMRAELRAWRGER